MCIKHCKWLHTYGFSVLFKCSIQCRVCYWSNTLFQAWSQFGDDPGCHVYALTCTTPSLECTPGTGAQRWWITTTTISQVHAWQTNDMQYLPWLSQQGTLRKCQVSKTLSLAMRCWCSALLEGEELCKNLQARGHVWSEEHGQKKDCRVSWWKVCFCGFEDVFTDQPPPCIPHGHRYLMSIQACVDDSSVKMATVLYSSSQTPNSP